RAVMFVAGPDGKGKQTVMQLVTDVGDLTHARLLEPLAMLWIKLAFAKGLGVDCAFVLARRKSQTEILALGVVNIRFGESHVRFQPKSRHSQASIARPLSARSRHRTGTGLHAAALLVITDSQLVPVSSLIFSTSLSAQLVSKNGCVGVKANTLCCETS